MMMLPIPLLQSWRLGLLSLASFIGSVALLYRRADAGFATAGFGGRMRERSGTIANGVGLRCANGGKNTLF